VNLLVSTGCIVKNRDRTINDIIAGTLLDQLHNLAAGVNPRKYSDTGCHQPDS
jgi:hypothetical protein